MPEQQNVEYKQSWRDEYLKWICGFANAQGGSLLLGIDDMGSVFGLVDAKKLMEDIPNKIASHLGLVIDVNLI
jgi:ATP-dependent DNA helicase RecG